MIKNSKGRKYPALGLIANTFSGSACPLSQVQFLGSHCVRGAVIGSVCSPLVDGQLSSLISAIMNSSPQLHVSV